MAIFGAGPSGASRELRRIEVECINAEPEAVSPFVEQLRAAARLEPVEMSKFRAGLAAAGLEPPSPGAGPMKLFLVRHAIAHERNRKRWSDDAERPLTAEGRRKFIKAARGLAGVLPKSAVVLTSPYIRARDTAAILAKALGGKKIVECGELASGEPARKAFELLRTRKEQSVVLVGHEPNLSILLSACLHERARLDLGFKKGGAACVEFSSRVQPGRGCLAWFLPPRVLRALR